jgi:hypothetical protein
MATPLAVVIAGATAITAGLAAMCYRGYKNDQRIELE